MVKQIETDVLVVGAVCEVLEMVADPDHVGVLDPCDELGGLRWHDGAVLA